MSPAQDCLKEVIPSFEPDSSTSSEVLLLLIRLFRTAHIPTPTRPPSPRFRFWLRLHINTMPKYAQFNYTAQELPTDRTGSEWEDGPFALRFQPHLLPLMKHPLITNDQLSLGNLPPFHRRMRDCDLGEFQTWLENAESTQRLSAAALEQLWPADFTTARVMRETRMSAGTKWNGNLISLKQPKKPTLYGGPSGDMVDPKVFGRSLRSMGRPMTRDPSWIPWSDPGSESRKRKNHPVIADDVLQRNGRNGEELRTRFPTPAATQTPRARIAQLMASRRPDLLSAGKDESVSTEKLQKENDDLKAQLRAKDESLEREQAILQEVMEMYNEKVEQVTAYQAGMQLVSTVNAQVRDEVSKRTRHSAIPAPVVGASYEVSDTAKASIATAIQNVLEAQHGHKAKLSEELRNDTETSKSLQTRP